LALANYYWASRRVADTERIIVEAVAVDQNDLSVNRALATLYLSTNRAAEAELPLRRAADASDDAQPKLLLADYYVGQKRFDDALAILDKLATRPEAFAAATSRRAGVEYQLDRREQAYALLDQVLAKEPKNTQVLVLKGNWQMREKNIEAATASAQAALRADARSWPAHDLLGTIYAMQRKRDEAIKSFTEVLQLNPRALHAQVALSELNLASGKTEAAIRFADEAVQTQPTSGLAHIALARALLAHKDFDRGRQEIGLLVDALPKVATIQSLYGQLQQAQGNHAAARTAFETAARIEPSSVEALAGLVRLDLASKQTAQAVKRIEQYTETTTDNPVAFYLAARTYAAANQLPEAETAVKKAIELDAHYLEAYGLLGQLYVRQQKLDEAREEYERIIAKRPTDVAAHTMIGMLLQTQEKNEEAKKIYEQILTFDSNAVVAANNLAYMFAEQGNDLDRALNLAQTAKAARPDDPDVNDTLAWVFYKRNLPSMAVEPLEQSVKANPANPIYHYHLGLVYLQMEQKGKARASLQQALKLSANFDGAANARKLVAGL
jgi:tetratricopeptide (TPR) repeat protein